MVCRSKCKTGLTEEQKKILEALAKVSEPVATKDIAEATGIPSKSVSCRLRSLKNKGYIESPARCKYSITDTGRSEVS